MKNNKSHPKTCKTYQEIADFCGMSQSNMAKTYFVKAAGKKKDMGRALDVGTYLLSRGINEEDIKFMADFMIEYKIRLSKKLEQM